MLNGANIRLVTSAATHSRPFHPRQAIEQFRETLRLDPRQCRREEIPGASAGDSAARAVKQNLDVKRET